MMRFRKQIMKRSRKGKRKTIRNGIRKRTS